MGHGGKCANIHGHSYVLTVTLIGKAIQEDGHPKNGMIMDFVDLKRLVKDLIVGPYDHALVLHEKDEIYHGNSTQKLIRLPYQPTCENMVVKFGEVIAEKLPENIKLHHVRLRETASSFAEYYVEDNE